MGTMDPRTPIRADHRFIYKYVSSLLGGKIELVPDEFSSISDVFLKAGGSWEKIFHGSMADIVLLKKVIKTAYDEGYLTKKHKWVQDDKKSKGSGSKD